MINSILLRTRNEEKELAEFTARIPRNWELIVVDHASSDRTVEVAKRVGAKVVNYSRKEYSYGAAINSGISECAGEWVLVASLHFEPLIEQFWEKLSRDLKDLPLDVLACQPAGFLTAQAAQPSSGITFFDGNDLDSGFWKIYGNSCCAYRRSALERFPFDESLASAEDAEWCVRIVRGGYRIAVDYRLPYLYRNRAPLIRYWKRGRADGPAVSEAFGVDFRPRWRGLLGSILKDFGWLLFGRIPWWLWIRLLVKRLAEFSLLIAPVKEKNAVP